MFCSLGMPGVDRLTAGTLSGCGARLLLCIGWFESEKGTENQEAQKILKCKPTLDISDVMMDYRKTG